MKKRLRKKLQCGEYRSYGFTVHATVPSDTDETWSLASDFAIERGISLGGLLNGKTWDLFAYACECRSCGRRYRTADDADREAIRAYFVAAGAKDVEVGPLVVP